MDQTVCSPLFSLQFQRLDLETVGEELESLDRVPNDDHDDDNDDDNHDDDT